MARATGGLGAAATLALLAGPLLSMVDSNVVNVAIPDITRELHGSLTSVQWTVSGYLLALAATLPATSFLAKRLGTVRVYAVSLAGFTLASVLCAFAQNIPELVAARAAQGVAAAPLVPLSMSLTLGRRDKIPTSAGIVLFLGPALGPTVGGLLVAAWSWPAIFLVNAPIGLAALAALPVLRRRGIVDERDPAARFDPAGLLLLSGGLVLAIYGAGEGPTHGWGSARSWPFWCAGVLLLCGYGWWARGREHPAVDLRLLRRAQSALAVWLCTITSVAMFSVLFLLPVLLQDIQGHGPLASGLVLLPQGLVMGLSTRYGMTLGERGGLRRGIVAGLVAIGATTALLLLVTVHTPLWIVSVIMAGRGLGIGLVIQPLLLAMLAGLSPGQLADANTLFNVGQRLGGSIGVGLLATFFTLRVTVRVRDALGPAASRLRGMSTGSLASAPQSVRPRLADAAAAGFHDTIWLGVGIAAVGVLCALFLRPAVFAGSGQARAGDTEEPATAPGAQVATG
ncbi:DHA2 family efflux MFS transporter permease subunit [Rugosimonospora africana]|uniref:MFS transporter n=1 Tax=Rugosimonospora africana TaxID=556532 RepID=A0A8J3QNH9_9ACTN|nr:DHA2 family efflux MFS transporter permease subunit [Rugosimonospora africana]GIH13309.1 MFS transporter [Rugosimonospora africana]